MSKRVEVREGDSFRIAPVGNVWQFRDGRRRCVVSYGKFQCGEWCESFNDGWTAMPHAAARAWIESLGGEWAEVAEEKPATTTKTVHLYAGPSKPASVFMYDGKLEQVSPGMKYLGTATFTIAGVTT
jgi:hypothetical protein